MRGSCRVGSASTASGRLCLAGMVTGRVCGRRCLAGVLPGRARERTVSLSHMLPGSPALRATLAIFRLRFWVVRPTLFVGSGPLFCLPHSQSPGFRVRLRNLEARGEAAQVIPIDQRTDGSTNRGNEQTNRPTDQASNQPTHPPHQSHPPISLFRRQNECHWRPYMNQLHADCPASGGLTWRVKLLRPLPFSSS